jgi:hypothetical protein
LENVVVVVLEGTYSFNIVGGRAKRASFIRFASKRGIPTK